MRGAIWYANRQRYDAARFQLQHIIDKYEQLGIKPVQTKISQKFGDYIVFSNNDIWRTVLVTNAGRATRSNIVYIDRNIPIRLIEEVILPTNTALPYHGINYWGDISEEKLCNIN